MHLVFNLFLSFPQPWGLEGVGAVSFFLCGRDFPYIIVSFLRVINLSGSVSMMEGHLLYAMEDIL